ncbi:MAG TPA: hypothetical protein VFH30_19665 [Acidimicrobiales bacterium]|nr:hypothetical protein [Acidimicrobiales bacterium]
MSNPEVHAPAPAVGSPTEEPEATGRGAGDQAHGESAPAPRATVAESLADIRADRIVADARREAQAIVDTARVDARREARVIVDSARSEAETIITEAFEQRARIVRRDWAIGDGSWSLAGATDEGERGDAPEESTAAGRESAAGVPTPAEEMPAPVAAAADDVEDAPHPLPDVGSHPLPEVAPRPGPDVARPVPEVAPRPGPDVAPRPVPEVVPRPGSDVAPRPVPDVAAAAKLSELIELPALRARERLVSPPPRPEPPHEPRPPLPARPRRGAPPLPRSSPQASPPPPPPPPAPPVPARTASRPRPRIERELPAGMRIPPDVPDWDDDYDDAEDR